MPSLFIPPHLPLSISRPRFLAFLRAFPLPSPLPAAFSLHTPPLALARECWPFPFFTPALADGADDLTLLSNPTGSASIVDACRAAKVSLPLSLPLADLAAVLLTRRATDASFEPVYERALLPFARIVPRVLPLELVALAPRRAADPALFLRAVAKLLGPGFVDAWYGEDEHGSLHFAIIRRAPARAAFAGPAAERRVRRDDTADVVRVDVPDGRIVVRCDDPRLEHRYVKAAGESLFGDPRFFTSAGPTYTQKSVVNAGSDALAAARPDGITRMRIIDITSDDGEGSSNNIHGSEALPAFEKRGGAHGGYVTGTMYRMDTPLAARPLDVTICLPDRAEYRYARHERLARAALASVGSFSPGAVPDDAFTLAPFVHAEWRWVKLFTAPVFERMCAGKHLVPAKTRMVSDPAMGKYGWSYVSFDLRSAPGTKYAVAMNRSLPSRDLRKDELRMWRLDPAVVARLLAHDLATDPAEPDATIASALDLGIVRDAELALRIFAVLRAPGPSRVALVDAMRRAAGSAHLVVLLPEGRTIGAPFEIGLTLPELFGLAHVAPKVFGRVAATMGPAGLVAPWRLAAPGTRFVADEKSGRMWLDRHELVLPNSASRLLLGVARGGGNPVPTSTLARFIAAKRSDDGVVRQTVPRLGDWIRESFAAKGLVAPADAGELVDFVPNKGWRMTVACEVR